MSSLATLKLETASGAECAELLFEELRERQALPASYIEAARFADQICAFVVEGHYERLFERFGLPGTAVPKRRRRRFTKAFVESLSGRMRKHFSTGEQGLGSGVTWKPDTRIPIGSIAVEDIGGGTWVQLLMWASFHVFDASKTLISSGATLQTTLPELLSLDAVAARRLVEGHLAIGTLLLDERLTGLLPVDWRDGLERAAGARSAVASRGFLFGSNRAAAHMADMKTEALEVMLAPMDPTRYSGYPPEYVDAIRIRLWTGKYLIRPLIERGLITAADAFDRIFMPARISAGTHWDYDKNRLTGGPDSLVLFTSARSPAMGYSPFILRSHPVLSGDPREAKLIVDYHMNDMNAERTHKWRVQQVNWLLSYEL